MSLLTVKQQSNFDGFPKAAELIEIAGAHHLEALDRANFNQLLQVAHDSDRLMEPGASWEVTFASLRRAASKHESNDRIRDSLRRLRRTEVTVRYISTKDGRARKLETSLLTFTDTAGHYVYTAGDSVGADSFTLQVSDGHGGVASEVVHVAATNAGPLVTPGSGLRRWSCGRNGPPPG